MKKKLLQRAKDYAQQGGRDMMYIYRYDIVAAAKQIVVEAIARCEEVDGAENDERGNYWFADYEHEAIEAVVSVLYQQDRASALWTDVKRELPQVWQFLANCSSQCIVMTKGNYTEWAFYDQSRRCWKSAYDDKILEVTHWLKAPPFPRECYATAP